MVLIYVFISIVFILFILHLYFVRINDYKFKNSKKIILQIQVSKTNEKTPKVAEYIFATLHSSVVSGNIINWFFGLKSPRFSFEIATIKQYIYFYVWCPENFKNLIIGQLYAQYPDIEIIETEDYAYIRNRKQFPTAIIAELETTDPYIYPIKRYPEFEDKNLQMHLDPLSAVTATFSRLNATDEQLWAQVVIIPLDNAWRHRGELVAKKIKGGFYINSPKYANWYTNMLLKQGIKCFIFLPLRFLLSFIGLSPKKAMIDRKEETEKTHDKETVDQAITGKLAQLGFYTNIRLVYIPRLENVQRAHIKMKELAASFYQFNLPRFNSFRVKSLVSKSQIALKRFQDRKIINPFILNSEELATLWHLPNIYVETPSIQWVRSKKLEAPLNLPLPDNIPAEEFTVVGKTNFRGENTVFGMKTSDRRRHIYIIGKTGMGKSTILENMIFSDIQNNKGVAIIDPHGDLAEAVLNFIPKRRTNDVVLFDPSDIGYPVSFNMLECKNPEHRHLVASGLIGVFKKMFGDSWGPRLEHIFRNTLLALTEYPNSTMLGIMKMLTDTKFREKVIQKVTDPMVLDFWKKEFGAWQPRQVSEAVSPIQNKVGQFLSSSIIRNIFGQPKSSIDLRFSMDKKKIIIVNLSKGKIGEDNSALLGAMMVTKFQLDAMSRADIPEKERKDFYLYVDEFQNFATDSFAVILSEARKYKLNLTMANQYIAQMSDEVKDAVFGNVGSIICCQVGAEDAEFLVSQFSEQVSINDLVDLPKYQSYVKIMVDGMPSQTFSVNNLPPPLAEEDPDQRNRIIKVSRERYGKTRDFVEKKILEWSADPK